MATKPVTHCLDINQMTNQYSFIQILTEGPLEYEWEMIFSVDWFPQYIHKDSNLKLLN